MVDYNNIIIASVTLVAALITVCYSNEANRKLLKTTQLLDFSKRYQEIMLAMPEDEKRIEKYVLLYFDLCSEEYRLKNSSDIVDNTTWNLWKDGMEYLMSRHASYRQIWYKHRNEYFSKNDTFQSFFDSIVSQTDKS